jgi:hypothetical protein
MRVASNRFTLFFVVCALMTATCSPTPSITPMPTEMLNPVTVTATFTAIPPTPTSSSLAAPGDLVRTPSGGANNITLFALDDLSSRLSIPRETAQLVRQETKTWVNDDFECQRRAVSGGTIDGFQLLYVVGETVYEYRTDSVSTVKLCRETSLYDDHPDLVIELDPTAAEMVALAKEQLTREFAIPERRMTVEKVRPRTWSDSSLGCPAAGQSYMQVMTGGYEIVLAASGNDYVFHTDYARVTLCESP